MINAYIIRIDGNSVNFDSSNKLIQSIKDTNSDITPHILEATTPETISTHLRAEFSYYNPKEYFWGYPRSPEQNKLCIKSGLFLSCYAAKNQSVVEACSISHMRAWDKCVELDEPIIVFESDALLTREFKESDVSSTMLCGLNDPRGATRRAQVFHDKCSGSVGTARVPLVNYPNEFPFPQGIAGNSAYYITPSAARKLLDNINYYGMYPNDAYMCSELFPWIRIVYPYITKVQGTVSTTTR